MKKRIIGISLTLCILLSGQMVGAASELSYKGQVRQVSTYHAKAKIQTIKFDNGDRYVGPLRKGKMHGKGTLYLKDKSKYEGEFINGKFTGMGKFTYPDGAYYIGQFKNYKFCGQGEFHDSYGNIMKGQFVDDKMNGKGSIYFKSGNVYEGEMKNDLCEGKGTLVTKYGKYVGEFKAGKKNGPGKFFNNLGSIYEGNYYDGSLKGHVTICFDKDLKVEGILEEGYLVGKTTVTYKGKKELIDFSEETRIQIGDDLLLFDSVGAYRGGLKDGIFDGKGTLLADEFKIEATFKEGDPVEGTMKYSSGETYKGLFDEDLHLLQGMTETSKGGRLQVTYAGGVTQYTGSIKIEGQLKKVEYGLNENDEFEYFRLDNKAYEAELTDEADVDEVKLVNESGKVIKFLKAYLFF